MKKAIVTMLMATMALFISSCRFVQAKTQKPIQEGLIWEQLFHKANLKNFENAVFSSDGQRFLMTDNYQYISVWQSPFNESLRELNIQDDVSITALQFCGDQNDVFYVHLDGLAKIWDKDIKKVLFEYQFPGSVKRASISEDERFIAVNGELYSRQKNNLVGRSVAHGAFSAACFGGSSLLLTSGYHDHGIAVRNITSGKFEYRRIPHPIIDAGISSDEKYIVAITDEGRCYLWRWPENEPKAFVITRESSYFAGFSPDGKWFVVDGSEFLHIFQTDPPALIARLRPDPAFTAVNVASDNLIVMGDENGFIQIYDVSAGRMIARRKVFEHAVWPVNLFVNNGFLWAGSNYSDSKNNDKGEITLYHIKGLGPYIEHKNIAR